MNKFPAVELKSRNSISKKPFFTETGTYGIHEIIAETSHHKTQLADLPASHIKEILDVYKFRIKELGKMKNIKYVQVFKNSGKDAGTSLVHSHSQIVALPSVPFLVQEKLDATKKFKKCPYCSIIKKESKSRRKIFETKNVIAFAPFASRFNYEAWIFPKKHRKNLELLEDYEISDIALAMKKILFKLGKINASYNMFLHYAPINEDLHLHFEIAPRMASWAGFELSTDSIINSVMPEDAAKFYRAKTYL